MTIMHFHASLTGSGSYSDSESSGSESSDFLEGSGTPRSEATPSPRQSGSPQGVTDSTAEMRARSMRVDAFVRPRLQAIPIVGRDALKRVQFVVERWTYLAEVEGNAAEDEQERLALAANRKINASINFMLRDMLGGSRVVNCDVYACVEPESVDQKIQGLMLVAQRSPDNPSCFFIEYLVTHPYNLCANSVGAPRVKGAGRCLIEHAKDLAREGGYESLFLEFTRVAEGFYKTCGFTILSGRRAIMNL